MEERKMDEIDRMCDAIYTGIVFYMDNDRLIIDKILEESSDEYDAIMMRNSLDGLLDEFSIGKMDFCPEVHAEVTAGEGQIKFYINERVLDFKYRNMIIAHEVGHLDDVMRQNIDRYDEFELEIHADVLAIHRTQLPHDEIKAYLQESYNMSSEDDITEHYEAILKMLEITYETEN